MQSPALPLNAPLRDLAAWTQAFADAPIPVLDSTAAALEAMRPNEDEIDASMLGEMIADDPLMTLKVLVHAAACRPARVVTEPETVTAALVLMGISPFFAGFGAQPTVEQRLGAFPDALNGLREVVRRAHRAANFALGFAVHRMDPDAAMLHQAALLHDFAEMLLWCHAPALALRIRHAQQADPALRSSVAQRAVLNVELQDLQHALMQRWRLPALLVRITDDRQAAHAEVQSVLLAVRVARHTAAGWDNAALPDDVRDAARLLNLSEPSALTLLEELDT